MNVDLARKIYALTNYEDNLNSVYALIDAKILPDGAIWSQSTKLIKSAKVLYNPIDDLKVGDGVTIPGYSDSYAGTIISRTGKSITVQEDNAVLLNGDELEFHVGGFAAHCSNQEIQKYEYTPNPEGRTFKLTRRKDGAYRQVGTGNGSNAASAGRRKFHDYNF